MIQAKVIADSKNEAGHRITTMVVTMPRIILAEFNTHRMFSRNSASSRAIPFEKMVKSVEENPFIPIAWQKEHKGMQGSEYLINEELEWNWLEARNKALEVAKILSNKEVTKQLCNRLLEPFMWHTVIVTATEWENFFALRCPRYDDIYTTGKYHRSWKDLVKSSEDVMTSIGVNKMTTLERLQNNKGQAEIHMMALAEAMWDAYNESTPKQLKEDEWHIPFSVEVQELYNKGLATTIEEANELNIKIATARCARVSYTVVGEESKEPNYENDIKLHDRLAESGHWSPFEHCAKAMTPAEMWYYQIQQGKGLEDLTANLAWNGNFKGFIQYRKTFNNENIV